MGEGLVYHYYTMDQNGWTHDANMPTQYLVSAASDREVKFALKFCVYFD